EEAIDGARPQEPAGEDLVLDLLDLLAEPLRLLVAVGEERLQVAAEPEVLSVEHRGIHVREHVLQRDAVDDAALQVGPRRARRVMSDPRTGRRCRRGDDLRRRVAKPRLVALYA